MSSGLRSDLKLPNSAFPGDRKKHWPFWLVSPPLPLRSRKGLGWQEPQRRRACHPLAPPRPSLEVPLFCVPGALVPQVHGVSFLLVLPCPPADTPHTQGPRRLLAQFSQLCQQLSWVMPRWGYSFSGSQVTRPGSDRQKVRALPRTSGIPSRTPLSSLAPLPTHPQGYRRGGQPCLL